MKEKELDVEDQHSRDAKDATAVAEHHAAAVNS